MLNTTSESTNDNSKNNNKSLASNKNSLDSTSCSSNIKAPTFEIISTDKLISLYEQKRGTSYFIPEGFEPVLIPTNPNTNNNNNNNNPNPNPNPNPNHQHHHANLNNSPLFVQPTAANLMLLNGSTKKSNGRRSTSLKSSQQQLLLQQQHQQLLLQYQHQQFQFQQQLLRQHPHFHHPYHRSLPATVVNSDVKFPSLVLTQAKGTTSRGGSIPKAQKPKKPPRPPNAFILYRRSKQHQIVAANEGISNNDVSKQVGEMWHKASSEEKLHYQQLADAAKLDHTKKYPEYKYRPRRPHEKRRRTKRPSNASSTSNLAKEATKTMAEATTTTTKNSSKKAENNSSEIQTFYNDDCKVIESQRRDSLETVCSSIEESTAFDYSYDENLSRRGSVASSTTENEISNHPSIVYNYTTATSSSPLTISPTLEHTEVALSPVNSTINDSHHQVCYEPTFSQYALCSMLEGVSPDGSDPELIPFDFLDMGSFNPQNSTASEAAYSTSESLDYLLGSFDLSTLISSNE
ncbi:hypothetical protein G9A89_000934 [Geosiphon pyriformis]|nr:hypothetical protein G9A89_000934 [Geosiphon pyriformis]